MPHSPLKNKLVAILACNGFDEKTFVALQQELIGTGASVRIISRNGGFINSWNEKDWGLSYSVDATFDSTLAIDYDVLVVPDGKRHTDLLFAEAHGLRIMKAFIRENMPVLAIGSACDALAAQDLLNGISVPSSGVVTDKTIVLGVAASSSDSLVEALSIAVECAEKSAAAA